MNPPEPLTAEKFRRQTTFMLAILVLIVVVLLAVSLFGIYSKVTTTQEAVLEQAISNGRIGEAVLDVQHQITDAIAAGPDQTTKALCRIFTTFDKLAEYHGFPPATDEVTRQTCAELLKDG